MNEPPTVSAFADVTSPEQRHRGEEHWRRQVSPDCQVSVLRRWTLSGRLEWETAIISALGPDSDALECLLLAGDWRTVLADLPQDRLRGWYKANREACPPAYQAPAAPAHLTGDPPALLVDEMTQPARSRLARTLLDQGLYVVEERVRRKDKTLGPWCLVAAFAAREEAYSFFGRHHQGRSARMLQPRQKYLHELPPAAA